MAGSAKNMPDGKRESKIFASSSLHNYSEMNQKNGKNESKNEFFRNESPKNESKEK